MRRFLSAWAADRGVLFLLFLELPASEWSGSAISHTPQPWWLPTPDDGALVLRYALAMHSRVLALASVVGLSILACDDANGPSSPTGPGSTPPTVRILFVGSTARRTDLPPSAQPCVNGVGATHIHPSWRNFAGIPLQPVPPDRYEITFQDVPLGTRVSFRVNDQNACDENATGAVTRNIFANDVPLVQNATTPGNGDEPGYAFTVASNGTITQ